MKSEAEATEIMNFEYSLAKKNYKRALAEIEKFNDGFRHDMASVAHKNVVAIEVFAKLLDIKLEN